MKKSLTPRSFSEVGFTLIEILVVATIIVLLTATAVVTYSSFLKQSRDARRKADLEQIRAALEMYRSSNDTYPLILTSLETTYIQSIPKDPKTNLVYSAFSPLPSGCSDAPLNPNYPCNDYSIAVDLESGETYTVGPYGSSTVTPTSTPTPTP